MANEKLPLSEVSIEELFSGSEKSTYEIPIYQRNYAWENDEIQALVQDVYDAYKKDAGKPYYIGTLVSYHKGDRVYEVIDGQQRLTTIRLLLDAMEVPYSNKLTYRARKKSDDTLKSIPKFDVDEKDYGIVNGFKYVKAAIDDIKANKDINGFETYFRNNVHIIHYKVPKDIDLNHYFEIMNSRGEQLEKHEIVKANLMEKLDTDEERRVFNRIWECCSEMSVYVQQNLKDFDDEKVFGKSLYEFIPESFDDLIFKYRDSKNTDTDNLSTITINDILRTGGSRDWEKKEETEKKDSFQPIIDFPNFLLIVLKIARMSELGFDPLRFTLDDKELLDEFYDAKMDAGRVRSFAFLLLKARFLLDNYVVHHSKEEDSVDSNPWKLQVWHKDEDKKKSLKNLTDDKPLQDRLAHLLSMFEVSFTARQRKNYLFYCLLYLMNEQRIDVSDYACFVEGLADAYFNKVYLDGSNLNAINTPLPGSFDSELLDGNRLDTGFESVEVARAFNEVYGDGTQASRGVPLFIFNYLDFKLWSLYDEEMRGEKLKENSRERRTFFDRLGCNDFGLKVFDQFYFSRTRRSLEHYYPQANATGEGDALDQAQINCLGNYAMIGSEANSAGSNWSPKTKLDHYLDSSGKISQISVASLKFMIMMQKCKDNSSNDLMEAWRFEDIKDHQVKMLSILAEGINPQKPENNSRNEIPEERIEAATGLEGRAAHITTLVTRWLSDKEKEGELHLIREKSDKRYTRFTTDGVTAVIPNAREARSGWGTNNHYFFEVQNFDGRKICMQFALSGKNLPDDLRLICNRINDAFPVKQNRERWSWRLPFSTAKAKISDEMTDEEIIDIISYQYDELKRFESKLIEVLR